MTSRRAAQAEQTRRDIVEAARRLFVGRGYSATSVRAIADAAGVSVQTIYDSVGGKADLLAAIGERLSGEVGSADLFAAAVAADDPEGLFGLAGRISIGYLARAGDVLRVAATTEEPALRNLVEQGRERHRRGNHRLAEAIAAVGLLADDVTVDQAADTMAILSDSQVLLLLRDVYGWDDERIEAWITSTVQRAVGRPGPRPARRRQAKPATG